VADVFELVARYRRELADRVDELGAPDLDAPSWCEGWRVRDVLGHLVHLAEATQLSMLRDIGRNGVMAHRAISRVARQLGERPPYELARRLRQGAAGRYHVLGSPRIVALGEVLTHAEDALRPVGQTLSPSPADVQPVLDVYRRIGRFVFGQQLPKNLRLVARDANWSTGDGSEVRGDAIDLLLLLANRRQVVPGLEGPGVARLG
jgi:uncharacterized protein (TIGR03083 family)